MRVSCKFLKVAIALFPMHGGTINTHCQEARVFAKHDPSRKTSQIQVEALLTTHSTNTLAWQRACFNQTTCLKPQSQQGCAVATQKDSAKPDFKIIFFCLFYYHYSPCVKETHKLEKMLFCNSDTCWSIVMKGYGCSSLRKQMDGC